MQHNGRLFTFVAIAAILGVHDSLAGETSAGLLAQLEPRIKAIYERDEFAVRSFAAIWLPDGSGYLKLETPPGAAAAEVVHYDAVGGKRTVVVPSEKLVPAGGSQPLMLRWFQRAPSSDRFLLHGEVTEREQTPYEPMLEYARGDCRVNDLEKLVT